MAKPTLTCIGLGSNLGDREDFIGKALMMLKETPQVSLMRTSTLIETEPLRNADQPKYLNVVAEITTTLNAKDLHKRLLEIEASLGRERGEKWSPRTIDLDILLFGDEIINSANLTIPHPQMHLRSFVLNGMCELCFPFVHPVLNETMEELAERLNNTDFVPNPELPQLISVTGIIGVGKTTLTKKLSDLLGGKCVLEAYDANPFLQDVYAGRKELALDSQLFFLTSRIDQLNHNALAPGQIAISDYIFGKELIYARQLLNTQQLALYEKVYPPFSAEVTPPVLVIYLTDSVQNCLERIHRRNRPYEQGIKLQFLEALDSSYKQLFADWRICPVIRKQMSELDYTEDADIDHLAEQIRCYVTIADSPGK